MVANLRGERPSTADAPIFGPSAAPGAAQPQTTAVVAGAQPTTSTPQASTARPASPPADLILSLRPGDYALGGAHLTVPQGSGRVALSRLPAESQAPAAAAASWGWMAATAAAAAAVGTLSLPAGLVAGALGAASLGSWWYTTHSGKQDGAGGEKPTTLVVEADQPLVVQASGQQVGVRAVRRLPNGQIELDGHLALALSDRLPQLVLPLGHPLLRSLVRMVQSDWLARELGYAERLAAVRQASALGDVEQLVQRATQSARPPTPPKLPTGIADAAAPSGPKPHVVDGASLAATDEVVDKAVRAALQAATSDLDLDAWARQGFDAVLDRTRLAGVLALHPGVHAVAQLGAHAGTQVLLEVAEGTQVQFRAKRIDQRSGAPVGGAFARLSVRLGLLWAKLRVVVARAFGRGPAPATESTQPTDPTGPLYAHKVHVRSNKPVVARLDNWSGRLFDVAVYGGKLDERGRLLPQAYLRLFGLPILSFERRTVRWAAGKAGFAFTLDPYRFLWEGVPFAAGEAMGRAGRRAARHTAGEGASVAADKAHANKALQAQLLGRVNLELTPYDTAAPRWQGSFPLPDGRTLGVTLFASPEPFGVAYDLNKLQAPTLLGVRNLGLLAKVTLDGRALADDVHAQLGWLDVHQDGGKAGELPSIASLDLRNLAVRLGERWADGVPFAEVVQADWQRQAQGDRLKVHVTRQGAQTQAVRLLHAWLPGLDAKQTADLLPLLQRLTVEVQLPKPAA